MCDWSHYTHSNKAAVIFNDTWLHTNKCQCVMKASVNCKTHVNTHM